jgi:hypothetical protein
MYKLKKCSVVFAHYDHGGGGGGAGIYFSNSSALPHPHPFILEIIDKRAVRHKIFQSNRIFMIASLSHQQFFCRYVY